MSLLDALLAPAKLPYDGDKWYKMSFAEQAKASCQAWYHQGFGTPSSTLGFYVLKMAFWIWIFFVFCGYSTDLGTFSTFSEWWSQPEAFAKAVVWTCLLEVLGLGGASGPLTAKFVPPIGASTYFLRPKTIKMPFFPKAPLIGGDSRNIFDVLVYAALLFTLFRACMAPAVTYEYVWPILALLLLNGLLDRTIYLAARADIYFPMIACFLFADQMIPAVKLTLFGIWFWAAFSKLTPSFVHVVQVMICNSPIFKHFGFFRKALFKNAPEDLRPSMFAKVFAHMGTTVEFMLPILLVLSSMLSPDMMFYVLIGITLFHTFIFLNVPMAVPMEWNVIMVYGAWAIFGQNTGISPFAVTHPLLIGMFVLLFVIVPLIGTFFPKYVSFLMSMRYYAGTWGYSIWLFADGAKEKVDQNVTKTAPSVEAQLAMLYDDATVKGTLSRLMGFRLLHLPTLAVHQLYDTATDGKQGYYWVEGEFFCGEVLGFNFGDLHLHHEPFLDALQKRCQWESGEVRVIMVESPRLHNGEMEYRIHDAKDGLIDSGSVYIKDLKDKHPWPTT